MEPLLIVAEHEAGALCPATCHALSAARELARRTGGALHGAILGSGIEAPARALAAYGLPVLAADHPALADPLAEACAPVIAAIAEQLGAAWIVAASTSFGKDVLPRAAARLGAAMASDVVRIDGTGAELVLHRPMWAGSVSAEVALATPRKALTVRTTEFPAAAAEGPPGAITPFPVSLDPAALRTRRVGFTRTRSVRPALTEARIVVAGGRGTRGDFTAVEALADALGAAVGATRAAVDAGIPNDLQVGQTGKTVAPDLYVAAGISGAIQHVAGMKGSRIIVAINRDPDAPIFRIADYGLVADLAVALPALTERARRGG